MSPASITTCVQFYVGLSTKKFCAEKYRPLCWFFCSQNSRNSKRFLREAFRSQTSPLFWLLLLVVRPIKIRICFDFSAIHQENALFFSLVIDIIVNTKRSIASNDHSDQLKTGLSASSSKRRDGNFSQIALKSVFWYFFRISHRYLDVSFLKLLFLFVWRSNTVTVFTSGWIRWAPASALLRAVSQASAATERQIRSFVL